MQAGWTHHYTSFEIFLDVVMEWAFPSRTHVSRQHLVQVSGQSWAPVSDEGAPSPASEGHPWEARPHACSSAGVPLQSRGSTHRTATLAPSPVSRGACRSGEPDRFLTRTPCWRHTLQGHCASHAGYDVTLTGQGQRSHQHADGQGKGPEQGHSPSASGSAALTTL